MIFFRNQGVSGAPTPSARFNTATTLKLGAAVLVPQLMWIGLFVFGVPVIEENGPMENGQFAFLVLGAVLLAWSAVISPTAELGLVHAGLAMLYVTCAIREVEVAANDAPAWIVYLLNGRPRNVWIATVWCILFGLFLRRWRDVTPCLLVRLRSAPGRLFIAGGIAYVVAALFDQSVIQLRADRAQFAEELFESLATTLMLLAALGTFDEMRQLRKAARTVSPATRRPFVHEAAQLGDTIDTTAKKKKQGRAGQAVPARKAPRR